LKKNLKLKTEEEKKAKELADVKAQLRALQDKCTTMEGELKELG